MTVMIVGEAWGADEERLGRPFVGAAGQLLDKWLTACGQRRDAMWIGNVINRRPPANKLESKAHAWITASAAKAKKFGCEHICHGLWFNDLVLEGVLELHEQIARQRPELIVALGNTPLWALTGREGIAKWRGSELWYERDGLRIPVIPTFHPAYVLRVWEWNRMVVHDLRTRAFGKMADPASRERPPYKFIVSPTLAQVEEWFERVVVDAHAAEEWLPLAADIEGWGRVDCIGFATSALHAICIPVRRADGSDYWSAFEWPKVQYIIGQALTARAIRLVGQNFNYDAQCIEQTLGVVPRVWFDTLAAQHVMLPGTPKDLAYLSSMYRRHHVYWKDDLPEATLALDDIAKWEYNCLDCVATFEVYERQAEALVKRNLWRRP